MKQKERAHERYDDELFQKFAAEVLDKISVDEVRDSVESTLMESLRAILCTRGITARALDLPALPPHGYNRRELALSARARITTSLGV